MIAAKHREGAAGIGKAALLDILHPGAIHAERHLILGFTRYGACMTSDTLSCIDDKTIVHAENVSDYWWNRFRGRRLYEKSILTTGKGREKPFAPEKSSASGRKEHGTTVRFAPGWSGNSLIRYARSEQQTHRFRPAMDSSD